ncbi:flavin reductase [Sulfolobus sp. A20]|uniref:flavin reductase family protein n=1 Tax=Saccharolobus sp. A20 TaxID=1891280 RepID=UPI000845F704|nr:flavin reductase family protein [Sulfolobus sp. A20]TRM75385.1 flavin reductase [Sulfolobus sp. A20-N-F8]TRM75774.1 flavin reductase [Sulfolobus sp. E5]TRM84585.1 flavin reductase [Sulfolobus sp. F3]TRM88961.1 flavin reductase [Sulfolobus sp. E3]TRM89560.1 flavin reductase [Sulfolobus sp. C3]TRM93676.1 flavin reductase [Sulfolobus sp. A20-N-G8]TRM98864.1 flavin reductase [Sulfolobus sp. F1]
MSEKIKSVMRLFPLGVVVVTTRWKDTLVGMTVNTFNSLSLNPPLVMFSADKVKGNDLPFKESEGFIVNFVDKKEILDIFAMKPVKERFNYVKYFEASNKMPVIADSYAYIEAKKYSVVDIGDHAIITGEVINSVIVRNDFKPIIHFNRAYRQICDVI